jgi:hypothetical protein
LEGILAKSFHGRRFASFVEVVVLLIFVRVAYKNNCWKRELAGPKVRSNPSVMFGVPSP